MSYENMKQLEKEKDFALKELSTNKIAKRYETVLRLFSGSANFYDKNHKFNMQSP